MLELAATTMAPAEVRPSLRRSILADGLPLVMDLDASQGSRLVDAVTGDAYLDLFSFVASNALGHNHPALAGPAGRAELGRAAIHKPSNSDCYTVEYAEFVSTFRRVVGDPRLGHYFFVEGGSQAVENALKAAFDFKSRLNEAAGRSPSLGTKILHLREAFHGRGGYTLSLTNTEPVKTDRFPKFDWPRISSPYAGTYRDGRPRDVPALEQKALAQARAAFAAAPGDIAAFIAEPIQGEGGDHHLSGEFLRAMEELVHAHDALFIVDEVQTGMGATGTPWAYQQLGLNPDIVAFGKKSQVCGIMAGGLLDRVPDNVFAVSSRLNSTWGGNLVDMVRCRLILEVIERDDLMARAATEGAVFLAGLRALARRHRVLTDPRGRGFVAAVSLPSGYLRDEVVRRLWERHVIVLGCGERTIRFRPALTAGRAELEVGLEALDAVCGTLPV
jgi:L-lysine 6-transaminase